MLNVPHRLTSSLSGVFITLGGGLCGGVRVDGEGSVRFIFGIAFSRLYGDLLPPRGHPPNVVEHRREEINNNCVLFICEIPSRNSFLNL